MLGDLSPFKSQFLSIWNTYLSGTCRLDEKDESTYSMNKAITILFFLFVAENIFDERDHSYVKLSTIFFPFSQTSRCTQPSVFHGIN